MHHFSKKSFEKALLEDRLEPILKECVSPLEIAASTIYSRFLTEMFNHMQWLLNEQNVLPQLKNRTVEFLAYLVLLGQVEICQLLERKLLPMLKQVCVIDASQPLSRRGAKLFSHQARQGETSGLEAFGIEYYRRCLESIKVWAVWLPDSLDGNHQPSLFSKAYKSLRNEGVVFPAEGQLMYYCHEIIENYEQRIAELEKKQFANVSLLGSLPLMASFSSQTAGQFWKNENKYLKENQLELLDKVQQLQAEIARLTKEVINRDKKIAAYEKREASAIVRRESTEDSSGVTKKSTTSGLSRGSSPTVTEFRFEAVSKDSVSSNPMTFAQRLQQLSEESQLRFKKSLIRDKYTLFKNDILQVGCKVERQTDKVRVSVYFRNMCQQPLEITRCQFSSTVGECQQPLKFPYKVEVGKQIKLTSSLKVGKVLEVMGGLAIKNVAYQSVGGKDQLSISCLHLPLSLIKLVQFFPSQQERSFTEKYAKVIKLNSKVLSQFEELLNCLGGCRQDIIQDRPQYSYNCELNGSHLILVFYKLSPQYVKLEAVYDSPAHNASVALLKELEFVLAC